MTQLKLLRGETYTVLRLKFQNAVCVVRALTLRLYRATETYRVDNLFITPLKNLYLMIQFMIKKV
ncbi:MAG: hypothetical protein AB1861_09795 [Cyanobacteriota bacterium]